MSLTIEAVQAAYEAIIVKAMARMMWARAFHEYTDTIGADHGQWWIDGVPTVERRRLEDAGGDIWLKYSPPTPPPAFDAAAQLAQVIGAIELEMLETGANPLAELFAIVMEIDTGHPLEWKGSPQESRVATPGAPAVTVPVLETKLLQDFGYCLVVMCMVDGPHWRRQPVPDTTEFDLSPASMRRFNRERPGVRSTTPILRALVAGPASTAQVTTKPPLSYDWFALHRQTRAGVTWSPMLPRLSVSTDGELFHWTTNDGIMVTDLNGTGSIQRLIRITFERVTPGPEDDDEPEVENGWVDDEGVLVEIDDHEDTFGPAAVRLLGHGYGGGVPGLEASSSSWDPGVWYTETDGNTDYQTGAQTTRSYHLEGFTDDESRYVFDAITKPRRRR